MSEVEENPYELGPELRRKSLEALGNLVRAVHAATITEEQFSTGVDVLFTAVSGLVPEPKGPTLTASGATLAAVVLKEEPRFIDMITACGEEITKAYPVVKRTLYAPKDGNFKVFRWQAGDAFVDCTTCMAGKQPGVKRIPFETPAAAQEALGKLADPNVMGRLGYIEVAK